MEIDYLQAEFAGGGVQLAPSNPLCPSDISPKFDGSAVEFGGEHGIEISYEN
jgi:hypothetical protein